MTTHVLIECAKRKPYSVSPAMPEGAVYNTVKGYWVSDEKALVTPGSKMAH